MISAELTVNLKYFRNIPAIRGIQQISTPGKRSYFSKKRILQYSKEQNWGESKTLFLSTKEGIITHQQKQLIYLGDWINKYTVTIINKETCWQGDWEQFLDLS